MTPLQWFLLLCIAVNIICGIGTICNSNATSRMAREMRERLQR